MKQDRLSELSMEFAVEILKLTKQLQADREYTVSRQIGRSGTSIGANIREARYASSRADFILKLQIALKEANETGYWLELLARSGCISPQQYQALDELCRQLRVILISSLRTAKNNQT